VDDGVEEGDEVSSFYDPMIAKVIAWGEDREQAIARMTQALREYEIAGVAHNIPFLAHVLRSEEFRSGQYDTGIVQRVGLPEPPVAAPEEVAVAVAAHLVHQARGRAAPEGGDGVSAWRAAVMPVLRSASRR
jgi:3-methylcrotonyl-CoA carboxylase alpha subunit